MKVSLAMYPSHMPGGILSSHESGNLGPGGRQVQFQDLPPRLQAQQSFSQANEYPTQFSQYQESDVPMPDGLYDFDPTASPGMAAEGWGSVPPQNSGAQDNHDAPKPKKTRRRKAKAPVDQETAQKRRRDALDKNKQAAAKCRARKKAEEGRKQETLQTLKRENQMLHAELFQMEEQVRSAKLAIGRHTDCEDEALSNARKLIEDIESNCHRLNEERKAMNARFGVARAVSEEDEMMSGSVEFDAMNNSPASGEDRSLSVSGEFSESYINAGSEDSMFGGKGEFDAVGTEPSSASKELQQEKEDGSLQHAYPSPRSTTMASNAVESTHSERPTVNPLWVSTANLPTTVNPLFSTQDFMGSALSSSDGGDSQFRNGSIYPELPSPSTDLGFEMPLFDLTDPMLDTSMPDASFDSTLNLLNDFDFGVQQQDQMASELEILSQMDSTYESASPSSSTGSKHSSPTWEALPLKRPELDTSFRRDSQDSALGPEPTEMQLLKDLQSQRYPGFNISTEAPSLLQRRISRVVK